MSTLKEEATPPARARLTRLWSRLRQGSLRPGAGPGRQPAPWLLYLSVLGPGLVSASAGNDAGGIATYASIGARYGYELIWVMVLILLAMIVVQEQCARMGAVTGKGLSDLIRERFGPRWTVVAMLCFLVANGGVTVSEFVGIGAAAELFGVSRYLAVPVIAALVWWLMVKGNYRQVERIFLALTLVFVAYPISAFVAGPDWGQVARSAVTPTVRFDSEYLLLLVATVGTTITPYMQMFQQDAVVEKGLTAGELQYARADVVAGCVFANIISIFIIVATAATLYVSAVQAGQPGVEIHRAEEAARALEPLAGRYAALLFAAGIFGASMLAAGVLPLATAGSICEAFGWERGVGRELGEARVFYGLLTFMVAGGAVVALIPGVPVIRLLIVVQVINGVLLPILLVFISRMSGDRSLMGPYANGPAARLVAWLVTAVIAALALVMVATVVVSTAGLSFGR
ncbi:MAG TPA: Nramp family divalent metal transporter [Chloroflexota bacterium]|jgi:NRAMP (natural resistance-associated macrophage protein)-like metal ion transporter|nr:Nramp family divalent metal transporter [Chloroflexota bacterium]